MSVELCFEKPSVTRVSTRIMCFLLIVRYWALRLSENMRDVRNVVAKGARVHVTVCVRFCYIVLGVMIQ